MTINNFWQGKLVRLRGVEPEDWEVLYTWSLDTELDQLTDSMVFPPSKEYYKKWSAELAAKNPTDSPEFRWMIENTSGEVVGTMNSHSCDARHGTFGYGLGINRPYWRKGYATEAIWLLLRFFFHELGYQKVNVEVFAFNHRSLALHRKLGFVEEGCRRRMIYTGGKYHDEYYFGMTREEFEVNENFNR
jgi:RimJ/RimL family protein N-acetyltransferase